jgi:peptidoglycan hydrolase FlgJ
VVEPISQAVPKAGLETNLAKPAMSKDNGAVARDFEILFMGQVIGQMMQTIDFGTMSGGFGEDMWRSFMANSIAEKIVDKSSIGLASNIEEMLNAYKE